MGTTMSAKWLGANWLVRCVAAAALSVMAGAFLNVLSAQERPGPVSLDVGTGYFSAKGNLEYTKRTGVSIAGQLTGRVFSKASRSVLVGLNASAFSNLNVGEECIAHRYADGSFSGCIPEYPSAAIFALLAGLEQRVDNTVAFRVLAGPARMQSHEFNNGTGTQVRADISVPAKSHVTFVVWGQYTFMPVYQLPRERIGLAGIGMRLQ